MSMNADQRVVERGRESITQLTAMTVCRLGQRPADCPGTMSHEHRLRRHGRPSPGVADG
jgi:hypothetical protein